MIFVPSAITSGEISSPTAFAKDGPKLLSLGFHHCAPFPSQTVLPASDERQLSPETAQPPFSGSESRTWSPTSITPTEDRALHDFQTQVRDLEYFELPVVHTLAQVRCYLTHLAPFGFHDHRLTHLQSSSGLLSATSNLGIVQGLEHLFLYIRSSFSAKAYSPIYSTSNDTSTGLTNGVSAIRPSGASNFSI